MLNPLCLLLSPLAALFLVGYSYTKRFTWLSHWILGFTDGIAAAGGWIAVRAAFDPPVYVLWFALTVWIAGFDLIYACQDVDFDRRRRAPLDSRPLRHHRRAPTGRGLPRADRRRLRAARLDDGARRALLARACWWSRGCWSTSTRSSRPGDLSRLDVAFFNVNGYIAVILFFAVLGGRLT